MAEEKAEEKKIDNGAGETRTALPKSERAQEPVAKSTQTIPDPASVPKAIPKAIPVKPEDKESEEQPVEIRKALPVGPLDEVKEGTLLQSATPSPNGDDE